MKKTELYKIVKEALNEVLQEQRARQIRIPNSPRPNPTGNNNISSIADDGCESTRNYGQSITAQYVDESDTCHNVTIPPNFICCSNANNSSTTITTPFNLSGDNFGTLYNFVPGDVGCYDMSNFVPNEGDTVFEDGGFQFNFADFAAYFSTFTNIYGNSPYPNPFNGITGEWSILGDNFISISCDGINSGNNAHSTEQVDGIAGCTDPNANNYDESATEDDGSCTYDEIEGCTDSDANNYDPEATEDDGSCTYDVTPTCEDELADNTGEEGACKYSFCNDDNAYNYSSTRPDGASWSVELDTADNSKCEYEGCTDNGAASSELPSTVVPGSDPVQYYYHPSNSGCQSGEGGPINGLTSTGDLNPENKDCCPVEEPTEPAEKKCRRIVAKVCNPARGIVPQTLTLPCVSIDGGVAEVGDEFKYSATSYMMEEQFDPSKFNLASDLDKLRPKKVRAVYRIISSQIANGQTSIEDLQSGNCKGKIPQLDPVLSLKSKKAPVSPVNRDVEDSRKLREQIRKTLLNKKMKKSELKEIIKEEIKKLKSLKEQIIDWDGNCSSVLNTWSNIDDLKSLCMKCNPEIGGPGSYYMNIDPSPCDCEVPSSGGIMKPLLDFCRDKFTGAELGYGGSTPVGDPTPAPDDLTVKPTKYSKEPKPSKGKLPGGPTKAKNPSGISILKKMLRDKSRK